MAGSDELRAWVHESLRRYFSESGLAVDVYLSGSLARGEYNDTHLYSAPGSDIDVICFAERSHAVHLARYLKAHCPPTSDPLILALPRKAGLPANCMLSIDFGAPIHRGSASEYGATRRWSRPEYLAFQMQPMSLYFAVSQSTGAQARRTVALRKALLAGLKTILAVHQGRTSGFILTRDVFASTDVPWRERLGCDPQGFLEADEDTLLSRLLALRDSFTELPEIRDSMTVLRSTSLFFRQAAGAEEIIDCVFEENNGYSPRDALIGH